MKMGETRRRQNFHFQMVVSYAQLPSHVVRGQWPVSPLYDDEMPLGQRDFFFFLCVLLFLVVEMNISQIFGRSIKLELD